SGTQCRGPDDGRAGPMQAGREPQQIDVRRPVPQVVAGVQVAIDRHSSMNNAPCLAAGAFVYLSKEVHHV
ncbi:hypothetical protein R1V99_00275, partial [Stenotrophomonas maltophilia]|nr:hypothetical protein [Stenotrophomonas maltophilia]